MRDVQVAGLAARQLNRVSLRQLRDLGLSEAAIEHRVASGRLVAVEPGVYAVAPALEHDDWGCWMGAALTAPGSILIHASATRVCPSSERAAAPRSARWRSCATPPARYPG